MLRIINSINIKHKKGIMLIINHMYLTFSILFLTTSMLAMQQEKLINPNVVCQFLFDDEKELNNNSLPVPALTVFKQFKHKQTVEKRWAEEETDKDEINEKLQEDDNADSYLAQYKKNRLKWSKD